MKRLFLSAALLLPDSEILKGAYDVLQGADLPTSQRALGELLGWIVVAAVFRLLAMARKRFLPASASASVVVVNSPAGAAAGPTSNPPVEQPEGSS